VGLGDLARYREAEPCAPMNFEGEVRLIEPYIKGFVYQPYGGSLDVKLWRIS
jgi:hypothetical protein